MKNLTSILKDVDSHRHQKDPFLKKYVDLTTSSLLTTEDGYGKKNASNGNFLELSKNLRLRTSLITAQISFLNNQLASDAAVAVEEKERVRQKPGDGEEVQNTKKKLMSKMVEISKGGTMLCIR